MIDSRRERAAQDLSCKIPLRDTSRRNRQGVNLEDSLWRYSVLLQACFLEELRLSSQEAVQHVLLWTRLWAAIRDKPSVTRNGRQHGYGYRMYSTAVYTAGMPT